jgi:aspartyl-tRNA(Asn)/glutamyl-tRNA(Gln) amidotransferase subunit B
MQMGHMRFEPNINVHITDQHDQVHKTAITEIKNLNSFSVLERATDYEIRRQIQHWIDTGSLGRKSTMGWDESSGATFLQREKEEANDYRYFPDPDLAPVEVSDEWIAQLKTQIGELPHARRRRYVESFGLSSVDAAILTSDRATGDFYEQTIAAGASPKRAANLAINVLATLANEQRLPVSRLGIAASRVAQVATVIEDNNLAAANALPLFRAMLDDSTETSALAEKLGLAQSSDSSAVDLAIDAVLASNPKPLQDLRAGKQAAMGALVGMVMKQAKGLNPKIVQERLRAELS